LENLFQRRICHCRRENYFANNDFAVNDAAGFQGLEKPIGTLFKPWKNPLPAGLPVPLS
jgi:hypothetical protein